MLLMPRMRIRRRAMQALPSHGSALGAGLADLAASGLRGTHKLELRYIYPARYRGPLPPQLPPQLSAFRHLRTL